MSAPRAIVAALCGLAAALAGCAGTPAWAPRADAFVGAPIADAVARLGPDFERTPRDDGATYAWSHTIARMEPGGREPPTIAVSRTGAPVHERGRRRPGGVVEHPCRVELDVDAEAVVRAWRAEGGGCGDLFAALDP